MRTFRIASFLWLGVALFGCGRAIEPDDPVKLADVPAPAMEAAKRKLPGITFEDAWREKGQAGAEDAFEIRGRTENGKVRDVKVSASGKILEVD